MYGEEAGGSDYITGGDDFDVYGREKGSMTIADRVV